MNEALRKGLNDRMEIANQKAQNTVDKGMAEAQLITQAFNGATDVAKQAISTYSQSQMRKDAPALRKGLRELADKYTNPDNPNAYNDYLEARKNYIDDYLKDKNVLFKGMFGNQFRASFEDDAYDYFDENMTKTIAERNSMNASEAMQGAINSAIAGEDLSIYDNTYVYKTTVDSDGIHVTAQPVKLDNLWDTSLPTDTGDAKTDMDNEKKNTFNHLLNICYANASTTMPTDKAKAYVDDMIPTIESKLITGDIAYMAEQEVLKEGMSQQQAIANVQAMFGPVTDNPELAYSTPYTGRKMSASEVSSYRDIAESYVKNSWNKKANENIALYNDKFIPMIDEYESNGGYVTTELFNDAISGAGIEKRFIKGYLSEWEPLLRTNDAMDALRNWFDEGQPMTKELTSFQNQYIYYDSDVGDYKYTNDAGYLLSNGLKDKTIQLKHNAEVEANNGRKALSLSLEGESYKSEAIGIVSSNIQYIRDDVFTVGANMVIERALANTMSRLSENGVDYSSVLDSYSDDPYGVGLTEKQISNAKKYAEDKGISYISALLELGIYNGQSYYDLGYDVLSNLISIEKGIKDKASIELETQQACINERIAWKDDFSKRYTDYEDRVSEYYGSKKALTDTERIEKQAKELGLNSANGNIDIKQFFDEAENEDGTVSTVNTISVNEDGKEILIPTTWSGKNHTEKEAIDRYHDTGLNFGSFDTVEEANAYAENLHKLEEWKEDNKIDLVAYVPYKPSASGSSGTSSSSKSTFVSTYGGVDNILKYAEGEIKSATEKALYPEYPIAGAFSGLLTSLGKKDDNTGHITDMTDLRMAAQSVVFTKEEKDAISKMGAGELSKFLFEGTRFSSLVSLINNEAYSESKKEQMLISLVDFLDRNKANEGNIDALIETFSDELKNGAVRDFQSDLRAHNNDKGFPKKSKSFNGNFVSLIKDYGNNRITQADRTASILGNNRKVDSIINEGVSTGWSELIPESFVSLFATDDRSKIWDDEQNVVRACMEGAFYFTHNQTMFNPNTDMNSFMAECRQLFDKDGNIDLAKDDLAELLYENLEIAGELYAVASAMHKLNDSSLNLGHVENVTGNEYHMSSGATVVMGIDSRGGYSYKVRDVAGNSFADVDTFISDKFLENYSRTKSNELNDRDDYYMASNIASGKTFTKEIYNREVDAKEEQDKAYRSLISYGQEFSNGIDYSDNEKISDGQFDKDFAKRWGLREDALPTLYNGWSMNGYRYNFRITTDSEMKYDWEPPKKALVMDAVKDVTKTWWSEFWKGLAGIGTNYTITGAMNKDRINDFTNRLFGE